MKKFTFLAFAALSLFSFSTIQAQVKPGSTIGIQIREISALAPGQRKNLTELGIKALIGGTLACLMTACIAGALS